MKNITRMIAFILVAIMMLSVFASCAGGDEGGNETDAATEGTSAPEDTAGETEPEATEPEATQPEATEPEATEPEATEPEATEPEATEPEETEPEVTEKILSLDARYVIIRPESCSNDVKDAAMALKNALSDAIGESISVKEDYLYGDSQPDQYEILIGQTNRDESLAAIAGLKYNDYTVAIAGDKLVITAYTDENLLVAVEYVKGLIENAGECVEFKESDQKTVVAEYQLDQVKFGETSLEGYSIVYPSKGGSVIESYAYQLQAKVLELSGILLPVKKDTKDETDKEILLGNTNREASKAIKASSLPTNGYSITESGTKIVVKTKDDDFSFVKTVLNIMDAIENGTFAADEGKIAISKEPVFTTFTFTDVHNNFAMLEPTNSTKNYIIRKNAVGMIEHLLETEGAVDMVMMGGDLMSDYPHWNASGNWPYKYFVEYRQLLLDTFGKLAKDGKNVTFVAGNHDYGQGEAATDAPHTPTGNYNSSDFYFGDAGMRQNVGELPESEMFWKVGEHTGDKYLLVYHYEMNGVHVIGLSPDPDHPNVWSVQNDGFNEESLEWLDAKLDEIDPYGTEIIFINCHYVLDQPYEKGDGTMLIGSSEKIRNQLIPIYEGHSNLFHFYGHWETWYHDYSVKAVLHYNKAGKPIVMKGNESNSTEILSASLRSFNTVNMGHFRPDYNNYQDMFYNDRITGYGGFGRLQIQHGSTQTPRIGQGVYVKVYENRIVFTVKNYGDYPGCATSDILEPYTVWLYK